MNTEQGRDELRSFMIRLLRHTPHDYGITLDEQGYCSLAELLAAVRKETQWADLGIVDIAQAAGDCRHRRYEISGGRIRAKYGHSVQRLKYEEARPPRILYHGTYKSVLEKLLAEGVKPVRRPYVYLTESPDLAADVGNRQGEAVIVEVEAARAGTEGVKFYLAPNEIWLSDFIPPQYMSLFTD
ncbi:RNA 2'-phosphotransferase [Paenibacillus dendritiformis]|uniref:RNA 2'-phosphotransferase n=1 Tax=Paenibacillus dendritiformis TaxID=130049 RepID=UPI000DA9B5D8|nr:RNA 2'-phosphotransferase [Paenibacillus dendritiformis]PZM62362.1 RNA 2'-phosphotransferase [Paenibacillus dendritiformis]